MSKQSRSGPDLVRIHKLVRFFQSHRPSFYPRIGYSFVRRRTGGRASCTRHLYPWGGEGWLKPFAALGGWGGGGAAVGVTLRQARPQNPTTISVAPLALFHLFARTHRGVRSNGGLSVGVTLFTHGVSSALCADRYTLLVLIQSLLGFPPFLLRFTSAHQPLPHLSYARHFFPSASLPERWKHEGTTSNRTNG